MDSIIRRPFQALLRPVASDDNQVLAVLHPDTTIQIIDVVTGIAIKRLPLPKTIQSVVGDINVIRWSPESRHVEQGSLHFTRRWIMLALNTRVVVFAIDIGVHPQNSSEDLTLLVDYQLETHLGKISYADFVVSHEDVLVIFETALHASMLSTTSPNRSDIPIPKYSDIRGLASSPLRNSFAMITKSKGQDNIAIFSSADGVVEQPVVFAAGTIDAQGLIWSPTGDPIIAIWDTAAHGIKVIFYTALGHPLRNLEVNHESLLPDQILPSLGISRVVWSKSAIHNTVLAIGDGHGNIYIRAQKNREANSWHSKTSLLSTFKHNSQVDGSTYIVWQESEDQTFIQQEIAVDLQFDHDTATIDDLAFNSDTTLLSSRISTFNKAIWIWRLSGPTTPITVVVFQHEVKQASWHPSLPHVLVITTNCKKPTYFCWHDVQLPPQAIHADLPSHSPTSRMKVQWLQSQHGSRAPLMISSSKTFDVGLLHRVQDRVSFESILKSNDMLDDYDEGGGDVSVALPDTPSKKPSRLGMTSVSGRMMDGIGLGGRKQIHPATDDAW